MTSHTALWQLFGAVASRNRSVCLSSGHLGEQSRMVERDLWGHSATPGLVTTDVLGSCWFPSSSSPGENISPPPTCPSCLPVPGQWGRGPDPRSPVLTPSRILGLMSCKMRRLQLTRTDGARTRLLAQHAPSSTRRILLQTLSSSLSRMPHHGVHSW